ncbi:hypothetical protein [Flavobacterium sp.]|uniref:hypothetical protein n=1 Tax=Flavobacterium sp. TaxID=239 RepID=UPI0025D6DBCF|nr:hypothetical protein [Flavobacterium sp.]
MKHLSNLDLTGNELQNAVIQPLGTPPSGAKEGQIYFDSTLGDKKLYFYNGTQWVAIQDTNNYVDEIAFASGTGLLTLGRNGALSDLTVNLDGRYLTAHPSTNPATSVDNSGRTYIQDITLDSFGHIVGITSATETVTDTNTTYSIGIGAGGSNSSTILITGSDSSTDSVTISGTSNEIEVTEVGDQINIGLPDNVNIVNDLVIGGNLTVSGSVTTVNTETILLADNIITLNSNATGSATEDAGIEVERGDDPNRQLKWNETTNRWEIQANDGNFYAIQYGDESVQIISSSDNSVTITNNSGVVDLLINNLKYSYASTIGNGSSTSFTITHNFGSRDVEVQLFDLTSYETVISDVVRTTINTVTVSFTTAPSSASIRVLIKKIG